MEIDDFLPTKMISYFLIKHLLLVIYRIKDWMSEKMGTFDYFVFLFKSI